MEDHLTKTATPARIRAALRRHAEGLDIVKESGCWYVTGPETNTWHSTSLNTASFDGKIVAYWVRAILDMRSAEDHKRYDLIGIDSHGNRTVLERGLSADAAYVARTETHAWSGWYEFDTVPAGSGGRRAVA